MLRGIQGQEVHARKDSRQGVEVRGQSSRELTPGGEEEHHRALAAVSVQELHQILGDMKAEDPSLKSEQRFTWLHMVGLYSMTTGLKVKTDFQEWIPATAETYL